MFRMLPSSGHLMTLMIHNLGKRGRHNAKYIKMAISDTSSVQF